MLKANIGASVLSLALAVAASGCTNKEQEAAQPAAAPETPAAAAPQQPANHPAAQPVAEVDVTGVAKAEGGKTVAEVFAEKDALVNTKVTVRGKVVKTNTGIMGKDWLHVRDGSGAEGTNDLTVTTTTTPLPKVGDTVLVTGTVGTNKDYGMGYTYPVIVEDAEVKVE